MKITYSKAKLNALGVGDERRINERPEFISKCRHQNKFLLENVKDSMD